MLINLNDYAKYYIKTPFDYNVVFNMQEMNLHDMYYRVFYATSISDSPLLGEDFKLC